MSKKINETPEGRKKRLANLKKNVKGQPSNNPLGRPKGSKSRTTILRRFMDCNLPGKAETFGIKEGELSVADKIALEQIAKAMKGDLRAAEFCMDGAYGKVPDKVDISDKREDDIPDFTTPEAGMKAVEKALKDAAT